MPESAIARLRSGLGRLVTRRSPGQPPSTTGAAILPLPPVGFRAGGVHFRDDDAFLASAIEEARRVLGALGSNGPISLLDVGCGAGRLAYGLIAIEAPVACYEGIDVMAPPIDWCSATISPAHSAYAFRTIDVYNERYNPKGSRAAVEFTLPFDGGAFDVAYAYSVFSHMLSADVRAYLGEIA